MDSKYRALALSLIYTHMKITQLIKNLKPYLLTVMPNPNNLLTSVENKRICMGFLHTLKRGLNQKDFINVLIGFSHEVNGDF